MEQLPGSPYPLGATWDGEGVNFALYSEHAESVEVALFAADGRETRFRLSERTGFVWHGYLAGAGPGQRYGYRVGGAYDPARGMRFNPNVVLLDPYARAVDGIERWEAGCFAYEMGGPDGDLRATGAPMLGAPRGVVIDPAFDWGDDAAPQIPLHRTVIYEAHVRGLTMRHPEVPEALRGTYAGVGHPSIVRHLQELGVTALELLPVHAFVDDKTLLDKNLRNYWGYSSIGFFAPDVRYRSGAEVASEVRQFKEMVKALHAAGIEVILDVVYNHTAEGNHQGPTFSFKGIDNPTYYRLSDDPRFYSDYTGTGNTLNVRHPQVLTLVMDSLRYWSAEMHVDGFRFDLASALARQLHEVDRLSSFFTLIHDSPALRDVKLIAEPWDLGQGGYQVGNFPWRWAEWNGRYRDTIRAMWKGEGGRAGELGYRLTGSSDLYESSGRRPSASINFITAHDGFTLSDLVSYDRKHNEANGEGNADGNNDEHSWNCGVEGPTDDPRINALRARQRRNLLATLLLSQGTPMILAGDELGRTQGGNNNAYCQDNQTSWLDWSWTDDQRALYDFTRQLLAVRRAHPALRRARFFQGRSVHGTDLQDLAWFRADGQRMSEGDWQNPSTQSLAMFLAGRGIDDLDEEGRPLVDDNLLLIINAGPADLTFKLPALEAVKEDWRILLDTAVEAHGEERVPPGGAIGLPARSLKLLRAPSRVIRTGGAKHTLGATYRVQLTSQFGFNDARAQLDYLQRLGVTDLYTSPVLAAGKGSTHGYDVIDHGRLNPELGTEADFLALTDELRARGMGLLVDWVPNHMGIAPGQNAPWEDVLENGPSSLQADLFDIDWAPPKPDMAETVLVPILGQQYGVALEKGELQVVANGGTFRLNYYENSFPLGPRTLLPLFTAAAARTGLPPSDEAQQELESICSAVQHLPTRSERAPEARHARAREKEVIKRRLGRLLADSQPVRAAMQSALAELNGTPGVATSFEQLDQLLRNQAYRLASWRVASEEINYRRFFDVNTLAAIRMEDPAVFERAHALLFRYLDEGRIQALRLDHTDGLYDPLSYFDKLQRRFVHDVTDPSKNPDDLIRPLPILVEKILEPGERLPTPWPIDGTTGYDFTGSVVGLWVDGAAEEALTTTYRRFTGDRRTFAEHVYECKQRILQESLASEVNMLARHLERLAVADRRWRDFTLIALTRALRETLAAFSVYRTYLREGEDASEQDARRVRTAVRIARVRTPMLDPSIFAFVQDVLLLRIEASDELKKGLTYVALRFQQLTGPVMAKSVEDTVFYRYNRLLALNEVGGDPGRFGTSIDELHAQTLERTRAWPLAMITTSTHDTKRGEDAAARIAVLSELPSEWQQAVTRWSRRAEPYHATVGDRPAPVRRDEYTFYQTLVGAWPFGWDGGGDREPFIGRMAAYMEKAAKEGKEETSWIRAAEAYDGALRAFVEGIMRDDGFMRDMARFEARIGSYGASNALAQTLLKLCVPGVPDTYQGSELWNQSLVDPDNRRPVDFAARSSMLEAMRARLGDPGPLARELLGRWSDGAVKLFVTHVALRARAERRHAFLHGEYLPIGAGPHAVAFLRSHGAERVAVVVPRLALTLTRGAAPFALGAVWGQQTLALPEGRYRDAFTGRLHGGGPAVRLAELLSDFPLALLLDNP
jgi:isoamylase